MLPSREEQAQNLIRFIGDIISQSEKPLSSLPNNIHIIIGAPNPRSAIRLETELVERGLLRADPLGTAVRAVRSDDGGYEPVRDHTHIDLSLDGWKRYNPPRDDSRDRWWSIPQKFFSSVSFVKKVYDLWEWIQEHLLWFQKKQPASMTGD